LQGKARSELTDSMPEALLGPDRSEFIGLVPDSSPPATQASQPVEQSRKKGKAVKKAKKKDSKPNGKVKRRVTSREFVDSSGPEEHAVPKSGREGEGRDEGSGTEDDSDAGRKTPKVDPNVIVPETPEQNRPEILAPNSDSEEGTPTSSGDEEGGERFHGEM
jgi:hypothetical protein